MSSVDSAALVAKRERRMAIEQRLEGRKALASLEARLKADAGAGRFLPARVVKFGTRKTVVVSSDEDWSPALVDWAWDASSGRTYMWKMIEDGMTQTRTQIH